jgi:putative spermidine/putrescine transport system permease protein
MLSAYVTINLIGGPRFKLVVSLVYDTSMNFEWPKAAALAFILLALGLAGAAAIFLLLRPYRAQGKP